MRERGSGGYVTPHSSVLVLQLDAQRYALRLSSVERVTRLVAITPLPGAGSGVLGIVNVGGSLLPVFELRRRFGLYERAPRMSDQLVLAVTPRRRLCLVVDAVSGVELIPPSDWVPTKELSVGGGCVLGVFKRDDGLILLTDLESLLSPQEELSLDAALSQAAGA
ncbi:MAG TPA: chemotaxis protein CheW [Polyangiaceae bacterium]|nr:chemotaxis protein CheW [Polyangiaceae bacterium]